jgi:hypothetical protein
VGVQSKAKKAKKETKRQLQERNNIYLRVKKEQKKEKDCKNSCCYCFNCPQST